MERRNFIRNSSLAALATAFIGPEALGKSKKSNAIDTGKAKNIIFLVSDGMSHGTLNMANLLHEFLYNKPTNWIQQYQSGVAKRALMDTASASSLITDSAAASSSWGGGKRVPNGAINTNADGSTNTPILQKFKAVGKKVGVVTTVPVTHATPAGFCVATPKRNNQELIASMYLDLEFDVYLGGGKKYFDKNKEHDDLIPFFKAKNYHIALDKHDLFAASDKKKILGLFADDALAYTVDKAEYNNGKTPTLAEMTRAALAYLENDKGFVLQIEAGKVDWAAHANDVGALLYDQIAFDEALGVALAFAQDRNDTLVIFTTDHGNASPGVFYGHDSNERFEKIKDFKSSNETILNSITKSNTPEEVQQLVLKNLGIKITLDEAATIIGYYSNLSETGVYNYKNLPYKYFGQVVGKYTAVQFAEMDHSGEYVELGAVGPYSDHLPMFIKNYEMHQYLLDAVL